VQAGYLRSLPVDPVGKPYRLVDGLVQISSRDALPFVTQGLPPGKSGPGHPSK